MSPYENYLMASVDRWEATLPENYHVIKLYDDDKSKYFSGKNKYGVEYDTSTYVKHHLEDCLTVYGEQRDECHCCEGSGQVYNDCQYCDGSGWNWEEVEVQCPDCDGKGEFYDEDEENHCSCENCDGTGVIMNKERVDCDECAGNGSIEGECTNCDGVGYFNNEEACYPYNDHTGQITFEDYYIKFKVPNHIMNWNVNPNMNWDVNPNQAEEDNNDEQIA
jgi:DnaJ-class molecular chaperone